VKEVQVLENHQAIKSLRDVSFSEQAAINLVLKDEAKSTWSGLADLGVGYGKEWLYDNRLMGMQFNKHFQTLMLYKNNNTGKDIGAEVVDLTDLTGYRMENGLLDMISLSGPEFERERYTFNSSHLLAGNWLLKTGADSQLRLQVSGLLDRERQQSLSRTTYLTIAGMPVVVEDWNVTGRRREVKGEVEYTLNSAKTYLNSRTKVYADWNASSGVMNLDGNATDLMVWPWKRSVSEDLSMSHTTKDGHIWRLFSSTGYTWLPGQLLTLDGKQETLDLGLFSTRNYASVSHRIGKWILSGKMGMDARRQQINDHFWSLLMPYVEPALQREFGSHKLDGLLRISYQRRQYDQNVQQGFCFESAGSMTRMCSRDSVSSQRSVGTGSSLLRPQCWFIIGFPPARYKGRRLWMRRSILPTGVSTSAWASRMSSCPIPFPERTPTGIRFMACFSASTRCLPGAREICFMPMPSIPAFTFSKQAARRMMQTHICWTAGSPNHSPGAGR